MLNYLRVKSTLNTFQFQFQFQFRFQSRINTWTIFLVSDKVVVYNTIFDSYFCKIDVLGLTTGITNCTHPWLHFRERRRRGWKQYWAFWLKFWFQRGLSLPIQCSLRDPLNYSWCFQGVRASSPSSVFRAWNADPPDLAIKVRCSPSFTPPSPSQRVDNLHSVWRWGVFAVRRSRCDLKIARNRVIVSWVIIPDSNYMEVPVNVPGWAICNQYQNLNLKFGEKQVPWETHGMQVSARAQSQNRLTYLSW